MTSSERWIEDAKRNSTFRFVGTCSEITPAIHHDGWYCNNFENEVFHGAVFQLPSRRGQLRFIAGYFEPWNDGALVDIGTIYDDQIDAALAADSFAEHNAEKQRARV